MMASDSESPLDLFVNDLESLKSQTNLFIYIGPSGAKWNNDIHIMFRGGGEKDPFTTKISTYTDLSKLKDSYIDVKERLLNLDINVGTHEEFAGDKKNQLPNAIFDNWKKETIRFHVSSKILWNEDEEIYYKVLLEIMRSIEELEKKSG